MAETYKQFDKDPIVDTSDVVIKGFRFRLKDLILGGALIVCLLVIIILAALLGAANSSSSGSSSATASGQTQKNPGNQCFSVPCMRTAAHALELINDTAQACEDFHSFACGNFPTLHPLEPYQDGMTTYQLVHDKNWERLRRLIEKPQDPKTISRLSWERKLHDFFATCNDHYTKMQDQGGPFLEHMVSMSGGWYGLEGDQAWANKSYNFQRQLELVHVDLWTDAFFTFGLTEDWLNWNKLTILIDLGGHGLSWPYYLPASSQVMRDYKKYVRTVGGLLLRDAPHQISSEEREHRLDTFVNDAIYVETEMAVMKANSPRTLDAHLHENHMTLNELNRMSSGAVNWASLFMYMFNESAVTGDTKVIVNEKEYIRKFTQWISQLDPVNKTRILNNYMIWRLADHYDQDLSWDYVHANRQIYVDLYGRQDFLGTWRYCMSKVDRDMKEALGALFVKNHFSKENKQTVHKITDYVKKALIKGLNGSTWMTSDTKDKAVKKIEQSIMEMGYPEYMTSEKKLNDFYLRLDIGQDYLKNLVSFNHFYRAQWNRAFSRPKDRTHWPYATYDFVAHYYNPWQRLYLPAGILQFPLYDHSSPQYSNFGSMGTIIGRQLTHAVDEIGNLYSLNGTGLGNWWSRDTSAAYKNVRSCIVKDMNNTELGPFFTSAGPVTVHLNASYYAPFALGHSNSLKLALMAYHDWSETVNGEDVMPGGRFSNDQMFFISFAQNVCAVRNQEREPMRLRGGWTPTNKFQVNAALRHVPEFQKAFQCKKTSKMVAKEPCSLF